MSRALTIQAEAVRRAIASAASKDIRDLESAAASLDWMAKGDDVLKMLVRLRKDRPQVFETLKAVLLEFPEATIARIGDAA